MIFMAFQGVHFFTQIPQPLQRVSDMVAIFFSSNWIHFGPVRLTGQYLIQTSPQSLDLQLPRSTIAKRVIELQFDSRLAFI